MAPLARTLSIVSAQPEPAGRRAVRGQPAEGHRRPIDRAQPRLIVAIAPTRGVDVASKALLPRRGFAAVTEQSGAGLLLASDELSDLDICDRIVVLVRGERFTEFGAPPFDREALIGHRGTGGQRQHSATADRNRRAGATSMRHIRAVRPPAPRGRQRTPSAAGQRSRRLQGRSRRAAAFSLVREAALIPVLVRT